MIKKARLSASVDSDVLKAAARAASRGGTLSGWVNDAMRLKLDQDRRLSALDAFLRAYEAEHGEISEDEMSAAVRAARDRATRVRSRRPARGPRTPQRPG